MPALARSCAATSNISRRTSSVRASTPRSTRHGGSSTRTAPSRDAGELIGDRDLLLLPLAREPVPVVLREDPLADAVRHGRDLKQLVVGEELDRVVERQVAHA